MTTLAALTLVPGPLVAVIAAQAAGRDLRGAFALAAGICAADVLVIVAISLGLGFWLHDHPAVIAAAKLAGVGYLLWKAFDIWRQSRITNDHHAPSTGIVGSALAGFTLCLSSPQTVVIYLVLLPNVVDLSAIRPQETTFIVLATILTLSMVFLTIILAAGTMRMMLRSQTGTALWGRCMSLAVAVSAVWMLAA